MAKRIAGVCYVKADGKQFDVAGGLECPLSDVKRETIAAVTGPSGYKETALTPYVKIQANFTDDFPIDVIRSATTLVVTAEFANGKVYTLSDAYVVGEPSVKNDDGQAELTFEGMKGVWL